MRRAIFLLNKPVSVKYLDSIHASFKECFRQLGFSEQELQGENAMAWNFGTRGFMKSGSMNINRITLSTANPDMAKAFMRISPENVVWRSSNGDIVDLSDSLFSFLPDPVQPRQTEMTIRFISPFCIKKEKGNHVNAWARDLSDIDLGEVFSKNLTRRIGKIIDLKVDISKLDMKADGKARTCIRLKKILGPVGKDILIPAFSCKMKLSGNEDALRLAYFSGVGEKTRYGFGCISVIN